MRFTQPRPRNSSDDALIPLINVVFLMLIFFMIVGQIEPPEALSIDPPNSRQGRLLEPERILLLMDAQGRVALDGEIVPAPLLGERLAARLAALREASAARAASASDQDGAKTAIGITLKADAAVTQGQLRALLEQLRALGVERLHVLSQPAAT
jgi:biopolymer transport protein ExbD